MSFSVNELVEKENWKLSSETNYERELRKNNEKKKKKNPKKNKKLKKKIFF